MIKYGYALTWNWVSDIGIDFHRALDEIALTGWNGVELNVGFLYYYLEHIDELEKLLKLHNLELTTFYSHLVLVDKEDFESDLNNVKSKINLIKKLGSDILLIDGGKKSRDGVNEKDYKLAVENIKKICAIAHSNSLKPTWHIHWGTIFDKEEIFEYLMENTINDRLYFCPDTAQLYISGMDPFKIIKKYKERISYIHFKDIEENSFINKYLNPTEKIDPKNNTLTPLSSAGTYKYLKNSFLDDGGFHINSRYRFIEIARGLIDFKPIVKLIKDISYKGWIVVDQDYTGYRNTESLDVNLKNLKYLFEE
jgi:sugar phosphate isomerase/epimerase